MQPFIPFIEVRYDQLMQKRIYKVLLICSQYDAFTLEEDGRIDEQIFNEYVSLNLRYPPQFIHVSSAKEAIEILEQGEIDLVITMLSVGGMEPFQLAKNIKLNYENIPIVVLTPFSREVSMRLGKEDLSAIDYVFSWLGNASILLAIIKLIEDKMNVENDVGKVGVQVILLVEDSIRFYSSYLPLIYKIIFEQSERFMTEGLNEHQKMLRMRGRPKILLATNYNEAVELYEKYKKNVLGVISDVSYKKDGIKIKDAGIQLSRKIKKNNSLMPVLLQSSEEENELVAKRIKVGFINKNSKKLLIELTDFIKEYFAFGDFVFKEPKTGKEVFRISDLRSLQEKIFQIPDESLHYHLSRNHLSKWLNARALFDIAEFLRYLSLEDFSDLDHARRFVFDAIANFRMNKGRGIIAKFYRDSFDEYLTFARIGEGSLGGKARGLAFIDSLIKRHPELDNYKDIVISIPKTVVLTTEVFDDFMRENNLYEIALSDRTDEEILTAFVNSRIPYKYHKDLNIFASVVNTPIAVRSSSLLEDSHYQPFAGIYSTYMIPKVENDIDMVRMISTAIKSVYASVYFKDSKAYMTATSNVIDQEKMAIVLQEVCGQKYDNKFYPTISGVARSINFYPIEPEQPEDGIANIAFGLGKYIVEGGQGLRFSPKFPNKILQLSNAKMALNETQKRFYSLDLNAESFTANIDDAVNLLNLRIKDAEKDGSLDLVSSVYDLQNDIIKEGKHYQGKKIVTFANILKYNSFPLAEILDLVLKIGHKEMNNPIEIEFAVNIDPQKKNPSIFNLLQIRPVVETTDTLKENLEEIAPEETLIYSHSALGNGIVKGIYDLIYVKPETFDSTNNPIIAERIAQLNDKFLAEKKNYILIGPGRWGSSDHWLGIPVKWAQISAARVIIESGLENYRIDPSQGTHFFQNLTSFRVGYFTINPYRNDGFYDVDFLDNQTSIYEDEFIRHIRFDNPAVIKIDGRKKIGVVLKPIDDSN